MRLSEAGVDLGAVTANARVITEAAAGAEVMAVVKADGFGHGAVEVAGAALAGGATRLGVTSVEEGLRLRAAGITAPVLSWLHAPFQRFDDALRAHIELSAVSAGHLRAIAEAAERTGTIAKVHLKVDTGLSRNGAPAAAWESLVATAGRLPGIEVRGIWSHLAGDEPEGVTTGEQIARFDEALRVAAKLGVRPRYRHLANSAAALDAPATHYDLVRAGIGLYGIEPVPGRRHGLRPAMTLTARLLLTKTVPAGTGVSYGHDHRTDRETLLGLVPLGYADGVPRPASGRAEVWVRGERRPVAGRIAMDQFMVDLGGLDATHGDEVVLFGPGDRGEPTAADWAAWAGTNPHEILTGVGPRVPRHHHREDP
ncbi:alanine racemase [Actinocorallia longicatena]|uniref:Alanine racemase n=1 Tax=Actinocorallia longicatena TaxID=111803 RepID=A0ABP6QN58_9ACTN